jgi:PAS domain S-box-containing protein
MNALQRFLENLSTSNLSVAAIREKGLPYWRERIFTYTLTTLLVLGIVALIPSVYLSFANNFIGLAFFDLAAYLYIVVLFLARRRLRYEWRAIQIILIGVAVGIAVFYVTGDEGAGLFWLFMVPPLASMLLGLRWGLAMFVLNCLISVVTGYLVLVESSLLPGLVEFSLQSWIVYATNFLTTNALVTFPLGALLQGLFYGAEREKRIIEDYRLTFDNNPLSMWVYDIETLKFLAVNETAIVKYGYNRDEFLNMTIKDIRPAEDQPRLQENLADTRRKTRQVSGPWKHLKKSGELIDVEIYSHSIEFLGRPGRLVLANDISEREQARAQLEQSAQILERVQSLVLVLNQDGNVIYANPAVATMLGRSQSEVLAQGWWHLSRVSEAEAEREKQALQKILLGMEPFSAKPYERQVRARDGELRWIEWQDSLGPANTLIGVGHDVTERKKANEKIRRQLGQLQALSEIDRVILSSFDLKSNLKTIVDRVITHLEVDAATVMLMETSLPVLTCVYEGGFRTIDLEGEQVRLGDGNAGKAAMQQGLVYVADLRKQIDNPLFTKALQGENFVSYYAVPLVAKGVTKGVLEVFQRRPFEGDEDWRNMLMVFGGQAAIAIDAITSFENVQRQNSGLILAYNLILEGWARAADQRDHSRPGHSMRVADLAERIASELGLRGQELSDLRRGALLHDLGNLDVPDAILRKPGPLTEEEWGIVKRHPLIALEMLDPIISLQRSLDIPYAHHERWDGSGYPRCTQGDSIPLAARIVAVADTFDALTSDRPYRKAFSEKDALGQIKQESGNHFDPKVVETFLVISKRGTR